VSTLKKLHVLQTHSVIGEPEGMRVTIRGLGLRGPGSQVTVENTPSFRGAIKKVIHLVAVKEIDAASAASKPAPKNKPS
jgi:large subunit ribosomal protein L30